MSARSFLGLTVGSRRGQHCVLEERLDAQQRRGVNGGGGGETEGPWSVAHGEGAVL